MALLLLPVIVQGIARFTKFPALIAALFSIATSIFTFFLKFFTRRVITNLVIVSMITASAVLAYTAIESLLLTIKFYVPPEVSVGLAIIAPTNFTACASVLFSARLIRWVWEWKAWVIQTMSNT
ncbi:hypothetical protein C0Z01_15135 [Photobacterium kishitanii]|uniref:Uncharacterized protein n=1 Tax=Photobacterium kishitanii TaxID=318456 RepID=A0A2T3KDX3_9GAMM|nr:DUF5455 family protein [Photobacterium kishitanii]OBU27114.1 hypothetical protein AYY22_02360 [Photobacterium kishitanii]OBU28973.1 hypothetical protein AYY23_22530 [Photobacterium kishitanii]PSU95084.1 hypothetical protein C9J27_18990 [Photobacterium kishitanii]PSV14025.1 hypothetical protein C0W28_17280 [Photobacterium kishitanii]PSV16542.1 hypothetical protein C0W59_07595 [Photobacterium kishitanii]